ncbi:MAG: hypothetical protein AB1465_02340 [Patescibacteria group bacterium]
MASQANKSEGFIKKVRIFIYFSLSLILEIIGGIGMLGIYFFFVFKFYNSENWIEMIGCFLFVVSFILFTFGYALIMEERATYRKLGKLIKIYCLQR